MASQNHHAIRAILRDRAVNNRLLLSLPQDVLAEITPDLEPTALQTGETIYAFNSIISRVYFVDRGLISLVKTMEDGRVTEIGVVGIEGMAGINCIFNSDNAAFDTVVQIPGSAHRMPINRLRYHSERLEPLRCLLMRYASIAFSGLGQTAACNRLHSIEERCCRWLLIAHDSAGSNTFLLTQEFLAMMLGVQRTGVSMTAGKLQKAGLIRYNRGRLTITDRHGLELAACECYRTMRSQLDGLFGTARPAVLGRNTRSHETAQAD